MLQAGRPPRRGSREGASWGSFPGEECKIPLTLKVLTRDEGRPTVVGMQATIVLTEDFAAASGPAPVLCFKKWFSSGRYLGADYTHAMALTPAAVACISTWMIL